MLSSLILKGTRGPKGSWVLGFGFLQHATKKRLGTLGNSVENSAGAVYQAGRLQLLKIFVLLATLVSHKVSTSQLIHCLK